MRSISPKHQLELDRREARKKLSEKSPETWVEEIERLPQAIRPVVGRIVWWDRFGERVVTERCNLFDKYLKFCKTIPPDAEIIAGLIAIGYSPKKASNRVKPPKPREKRRKPVEQNSETKGASVSPPTSPKNGETIATL
jgi:hypothetical protein